MTLFILNHKIIPPNQEKHKTCFILCIYYNDNNYRPIIMDRTTENLAINRNIINQIKARQYSSGKNLQDFHQFSDIFIKRLGLETELEGHQGCVNCLEWTQNGLYLASGSDDTNVILWDPFRHKQRQLIPTLHIGNIFSLKFLVNENVLATAAGDCHVIVQDVQSSHDKSSSPLLNCTCHVGRVKRLANAPDQNSLFWSAGEDGFVFQYDLREPHDCRKEKTILINMAENDAEIKCVAVNPTKSHYLAVGANDCFVRLYDRRMIKVLHEKTSPNRIKKSVSHPGTHSNCVQYYAAGHLAHEYAEMAGVKLACTYVAFNSAGSEMLVNIGGEQIYLFDVNRSRHIMDVQVPQLLPKRQERTPKSCCERGSEVLYVMEGYEEERDGDCVCFYMRRALKSYQRKWMSDLYGAARDYCHVIQYYPSLRHAYIGLIKCLIALKWREPCAKWFAHYTTKFPLLKNVQQTKLLEAEIRKLNQTETASDKPTTSATNHENHFDVTASAQETRPEERLLRLQSFDFERRYIGHCNTSTDIKEANFMGEKDGFIVAGSDEGIIFIWNRDTMEIVRALYGDNSIVNCVQPHKSVAMLASSGIDTGVKIWTPLGEGDEEERGRDDRRVVHSLDAAVERNQHRMCMDPFESMLASMGFQIQANILDVNESCRQS